MALTPFRWIAGAVIGCLAMAILFLRSDPPREPRMDEGWAVRRVLDSHGAHASSAARRFRTVALLDSIGIATRGPGGAMQVGPVRIFRDAALPAVLADSMGALAQRAAHQMPDSGGTGTDVVFVYDTLSQIRGASIRRLITQVDYALPRDASERCVALVHVGIDATAKRHLGALPGDAAAQRLLGPCAYYQVFGMPGRTVDAWLRTRGWGFAGDGSWQQQAPDANLARSLMGTAPPTVERLLLGQTTLPFLVDMQLAGAQCAAGAASACDRTLLDRQERRQPTVLNGNVLFGAFPSITVTPDWYPRRPFGRRETSLLADMVRTLGRERFARFWQSNEPVPAAFEHASGQPLDRWATSWAVTTYGQVPPRGAGVSFPGALVGLAMIALALLAGIVVSERRQFA